MKLKDWIISCICTGVVFLLGLVMLIAGCCVNVLVAISSIAVFVLAGAGGVISLLLYQHHSTDGSSTPVESCDCKEHLEVIEKMLQDAALQDIKETLSKLADSENSQENEELVAHIDSKVEEIMQQFKECKDHLEYMREILDGLKQGIFGDGDFNIDVDL